MEFDRRCPGGAVEVYTDFQMGKVLLEFQAFIRMGMAEALLDCCEEQQSESRQGESEFRKNCFLEIRMWNREGEKVFFARQNLCCEEPIKGMLLHPHMWHGVEDPYLYHMKACLMGGQGCVLDTWEEDIPIRNFREVPGKGWFLNEEKFTPRIVAYEIPSLLVNGRKTEKHLCRDLELIREVGANAVCPTGVLSREFLHHCDYLGLVVWGKNDTTSIPSFRGCKDCLVDGKNDIFTDCFYHYKALWSTKPFVYISWRSLARESNGNLQVSVYSNQQKVALYVEGKLFEFQTEGPEFVFHDIPSEKLPVMLTAEAGECSMSVTARPFT